MVTHIHGKEQYIPTSLLGMNLISILAFLHQEDNPISMFAFSAQHANVLKDSHSVT